MEAPPTAAAPLPGKSSNSPLLDAISKMFSNGSAGTAAGGGPIDNIVGSVQNNPELLATMFG